MDDDLQALRFIRRALEEGGYQVTVTNDPSLCAKLVQDEQPDLVLLDLRFPDVTGLDLLHRIRESSSVPVIFLTGSDPADSSGRAIEAGATDYITKPFSPPELLARIEVALRRGR